MRIVSIGGGPAGLYFAILMRKAGNHDITILERNKADDTFGFGVVFSDATLDNIADADRDTYDEITKSFAHWDDIDIFYRGTKTTSTGHGFSGLSRQRLLDILQRRAAAVGVTIRYQKDITEVAPHLDADLVLAADGANSFIRPKYAAHFQPTIDFRPNKFVWLGTTFPYPAFTFYFKEDANGLWRVHAYRYAENQSTFILETTEACWKKAGLEKATEDDTVAFTEKLFAEELKGHRILKNRSLWRNFPIVKCAKWHHQNLVLVGDAAHTAHFSIGSGTKLAMEDGIALRDALAEHPHVPDALAAYDAKRRPDVDSTQRAAMTSLRWFEETERYLKLEPTQFAFSLLTRSLRVTHENLRVRDPRFVESVNQWFSKSSKPPMFTPYSVRGLTLSNRVVVSPMCQYSADDGTPNDWHLVHLGSRALGGAALVITEMTDVMRDGRISPGCTGMYKAEHVTAWRKIVDFVHARTPAKIGIQLAHAGRKGATCIPWQGGYDAPLATGAWPLFSASPIAFTPKNQVPREMTRADMDRVRDCFARATGMAADAGFDWVELHMAHGYLLSCFISPLANVRTDEYGGALANRLRFPLEVLDAVRAAWGSRPLSVRISATDWAPGGTTPADSVEIAKALYAHGADIIDVSAGGVIHDDAPEYGRLFQTPLAERIRIEGGVPTMTVGAISSYSDINSILAAGRADLCVLARTHLYDPYFTNHAAVEQDVMPDWPNPYKALDRFKPRMK